MSQKTKATFPVQSMLHQSTKKVGLFPQTREYHRLPEGEGAEYIAIRGMSVPAQSHRLIHISIRNITFIDNSQIQ